MSPTRANSSQCEYGTIENEVHKSQHESELTRVDTNSICVNRSQNLDLENQKNMGKEKHHKHFHNIFFHTRHQIRKHKSTKVSNKKRQNAEQRRSHWRGIPVNRCSIKLTGIQLKVLSEFLKNNCKGTHFQFTENEILYSLFSKTLISFSGTPNPRNTSVQILPKIPNGYFTFLTQKSIRDFFVVTNFVFETNTEF